VYASKERGDRDADDVKNTVFFKKYNGESFETPRCANWQKMVSASWTGALLSH
jgi:hypothetical protein